MVDDWKESLLSDSEIAGVLHVGLAGLDSDDLAAHLSDMRGRLLITESCNWVLDGEFGVSPEPLGAVLSLAGRQIPYRLGTRGWGYETEGFVGSPNDVVEGLVGSGASPGEQVAEYRRLLETIDPNDPEQLLKIAPSWLLDVPIEGLDLSVRCRNVLRALRIETLGDLHGVASSEMLKWRNFGAKSVRDLASTVRDSAESEYLLGRFGTEGKLPQAIVEVEISESTVGAPVGLVDGLRSACRSVRDYDVVCQFYGIGKPKQTLQEIGKGLSLTRERARQIREAVLDRLTSNGVAETVQSRIKTLLSGRERPIYTDLLGAEDSWFVVPGAPEADVSRLVVRLLGEGFRLVKLRPGYAITRLDRPWAEANAFIARVLSDRLEREFPTRSEVRREIYEQLVLMGASELASEVEETLESRLHFGSLWGNGDLRLLAVGGNQTDLVLAVLRSSPKPMHYSEIARAAKIRSGLHISPETALSVSARVGLRMGRGTYGLPFHIPLGEAERLLIVEEASNIIHEDLRGRAWHASELVDEINDRLDHPLDGLDKFVVNATLTQFSDLHYQGRLMWDRPDSTRRRIDLSDAVEILLREAGRPMRIEEIRDLLSRSRGLNSLFFIQPSESVSRLAPNLYGLLDRDFIINRQTQRMVMKRLEARMRDLGHGLFVSELASELYLLWPEMPRAVTSRVLQGIAYSIPALKVGRGNLIYPSDWPGPRRPTINESIRLAVAAASFPASTQSLRAAVEVELGCSLGDREISYSLRAEGLEFDPTLGWRRLEPASEVEDDCDLE